jgi:hypothetical protein
MDDETVVPEKVILTPAKKNDRSQLDALVNEVALTYMFDHGYIDYARFDDYCERSRLDSADLLQAQSVIDRKTTKKWI